MRVVLLFIIIFTLCTSCENRIYYYIDGITKDTIASACFVDKTEIRNSLYKIVVKDAHNYVVKDDMINIISKLGLEDVFADETGRKRYVYSSPIFVYDFKGKFSDINRGYVYDHDNYYMRSRGVNYDSKGNIRYSEFEEHEDVKKEKARISSLKEKLRKDSIAYILSKKEVKLSFMEYKIGSLYSKTKTKRLDANIIMNGDFRTILDSKFRIGVQHYKDTIYKIILYAIDYRNGIYVREIEDLYKTKYADGNDGEISGNLFRTKSFKSIRTSQEKLSFKNGQIIFEKTYGDDRNPGKITEFSIIYLDPILENKATIKEEYDKKHGMLKERERKIKQEEEDFDKI